MEKEFDEIDNKNAWLLVYQQIRLKSFDYKYTCKEAKKPENKNLNRYRDVNPYDHTRVRLQRGNKDYINASLVKVPLANRAYILTQGPLPNTAGDFWLMVWEQKTTAVVMLNKVVEKHTVKCHQYWPLGKVNGGDQEMSLDDVGLKVTFLEEKDVHNYTVRKLKLTDIESGIDRDILHFHYTSWPDFGVPESPSAFLTFLLAVRASGALSDEVGPPVVHCSAGIGRSGTFCLVDSSLILIERSGNPDGVNIQEMLLEMRKYRMGLIQTPDQLRFSYLAVIQGARLLLNNQVPLTNNKNDRLEENGLKSSNEGVNIEDEDGSLPPPLPPRIGKGSEGDSPHKDNNQTNQDHLINEHNSVKLNSISPESEMRKRRRMEKQEHTAQLVQKMRKKQLEEEDKSRRNSKRRLLFKRISLGIFLIMSTGIIVYRYYHTKD